MSKKYLQSRRFSPSEGMKTDFGTAAEERTFCSETRRESRQTSPVRKAKRRREESTSSDSRSGSGGRIASSSKKRREKDDRKRRKRKHYSRSRSESTCDSSSDESNSSTIKRRKSKHKKAKSKKKRKKEKKKAPKKQKLKKKMKQQNDGAGQGKETSGTSENTSAGNVSSAMPTETKCKDITAPAKARSMIPMTKEEYEKQQSLIRRVYDPETGRNRLIRGDGEILEEIVSMERHKAINKAATHGDGAFFQASLGLSQR